MDIFEKVAATLFATMAIAVIFAIYVGATQFGYYKKQMEQCEKAGIMIIDCNNNRVEINGRVFK